MLRPPVLVGDFRPYPRTHHTQPYGPTPPPRFANPATLPRVAPMAPSGGARGSCGLRGLRVRALLVQQQLPVGCTNPGLCGFAMVLGPQIRRGGGRTRAPLGMCWSRYALSGPGSSFAPFPSGMAEMPNRGSFQDCAAKHRVWLVSTRNGFRTLPASLKTRDGRCTAFLSIVHESG